MEYQNILVEREESSARVERSKPKLLRLRRNRLIFFSSLIAPLFHHL